MARVDMDRAHFQYPAAGPGLHNGDANANAEYWADRHRMMREVG